MRARAALEDMLVSGDHRVSCRVLKWNADCQLLAQCSITAEWPTGSKAQAHDLGLRLVEDGWAYAFNLDDVLSWDKDASAKMAHFEALARQARKGLWPYWLGEQ
jgi:endonuclease YncB( thermonuclease family)